MENQVTGVPPTYKQMLEEMGRQLNKRKSLLAKRIFLVTWPFLLLVVAGYLVNQLSDFKTILGQHPVEFFVSFGAYVFLAVIYSGVIRFILNIEKQIWVDSYFDGRNLEPKDSWRIARKLFWAGISFRLRIFWSYYLLPLLATGAVFTTCIVLISYNISNSSLIWTLIATILVAVLGFIFYSYYLRIKLRYTWFIFLDKFGIAYSFQSAIEDMNKLNDISKSDSFKKSLVANLGTDTIGGISRMAVAGISSGLSLLGSGGQLLGGLVRVYGDEASKQVTDLGNISAQYILYRFARKELFGTEQTVNETIYSM